MSFWMLINLNYNNMGRLSFTIHILTRAARICVLDFCPFLAFHFRFSAVTLQTLLTE